MFNHILTHIIKVNVICNVGFSYIQLTNTLLILYQVGKERQLLAGGKPQSEGSSEGQTGL